MAAMQRLARLSDLSSAAALCSSHSFCSSTLKSADTASLSSQSHRSLISAQAGNSALQIRPSENGAARSRVPSTPPSPVFKAPSVVNPANDTPVIFENAPSRVGGLLRKGKAYKERFVIRSYEVGMHKSASIESIANLLQEVGCNHGMAVGVGNDGFAVTPGMRKNRLIWVITRLHVEMYKYPEWGDSIDLETWFQQGSGSFTVRDWVITMADTGEVIGRATSSWVLMNEDTRRLSRMPEEVRTELEPISAFPPRYALPYASSLKIPKLKEPSDHICSHLKPRRGDLDLNQHVNNVTYLSWMMESLPANIQKTHEVAQLTLDYRRECHCDDIVETLASELPSEGLTNWEVALTAGTDHPMLPVNGRANLGVDESACALAVAPAGQKSVNGLVHFSHLLRLQDSKKEVNKGRTVWRQRCDA